METSTEDDPATKKESPAASPRRRGHGKSLKRQEGTCQYPPSLSTEVPSLVESDMDDPLKLPRPPLVDYSSMPTETASLPVDDLYRRRASAPPAGIGISDRNRARQRFSTRTGSLVESSEKVYRSPRHSMVRQKTVETDRVRKNEDEDSVNQYRFLGDIGQGAYGVVREAHGSNNERYAIKIMSRRRLSKLAKQRSFGRPPPRRKPQPGGAVAPKPEDDPLQQVKREIAILKSLDHPNIINLMEVMDDKDHDDLYLVFELMENGPVMTEKMEEVFDEGRAYGFFVDLMLGVEYLHARNIIHRDIKPENLLLDDTKSHIKITDFGVSEWFSDMERDAKLNKTSGTPAFLAPEAVRVGDRSGKLEYSGRASDIWAMGVTLYCFVFGQLPFKADNVVELYERIREAPLEFPDDIPISEALQDFLYCVLEKDPAKRITIKEMREHPWITSSDPGSRIPSEKENCRMGDDEEPSEEQVASALSSLSISALSSVLMMIKRKSFARSRRGTSPSPYSSPRNSLERSKSPSGLNNFDRSRSPSGDSFHGFLSHQSTDPGHRSPSPQFLSADVSQSLPANLSKPNPSSVNTSDDSCG